MPNWSDGDGGCDCPSGHQAGIGRHREGDPGCISGPAEFVGKKTVTETRLAEHTCVICGHVIGEHDACIWHAPTKMVYCGDRCSQAYLMVKCPWCFAEREACCIGKHTHPTRIFAAAEYVKKLTSTPIETLIERSSLGAPQAKRMRDSVSPETVDRVLRKTIRKR